MPLTRRISALAPILIYSAALAAILLVRPAAAADEWPQWRGPHGQGHAATSGLPLEWSETKNITWNTPLPGQGHSSPVISGQQIWLTAATDTPVTPEEKERRLADNTGNQPLTVSGKVTFHAICVDRASGKLVHNIELMSEAEPQPTHALNTYASPSPVIESGRLYCNFGTHGTACVDTESGKVVWRNRDLRIKHENGAGSTPVLWKDKLIVHYDGSDKQFVAALDKATGKVAWKTRRSGEMNSNPQLKKAYGTPLVTEINGRDVLISPAADWLYGYDPATGRELWRVNYGTLGFSIVPRPVTGHGMVFICTSYMKSQVLAVKVEGTGRPKIVWRLTSQAPKKPSPLLVGEQLYIVSDNGVATCLSAKTGEVIWRERLRGNYSASPMFAEGRVYFFSQEGVTTVIEAGSKFQLLARNELDGGHMASPAAVGDELYLRTTKALYRIERK